MTGDITTTAARTFEHWRVISLSDWGAPMIAMGVTVAVIAVLLSVWGFRHQPIRVRLLLTSLRALAVLAVLTAVLQPAIQLRSVTTLPNHVVVLLDTSQSMSMSERRGEPARIAKAAALLERSRDRLDSWRRDRAVDLYAFDGTLHALLTDPKALRAHGPATHIRRALEQVRQRYRGSDLAGIVLISDGIDNGRLGSGKLARAQRAFVADIGAPIHTVWVGGRSMRDVAIGQIEVDDFAFVRNAISVDVEVSVTGMRLQSLPVTLRQQDTVVARQTVDLMPNKAQYRLRFDFVPERVGQYVYTVSVPVQAGEAIKTNNSGSFLLNVIRDRIRVLHVSGRPSWDERFLRRFLKRDPNVDLISFFILRTPASVSLVPSNELSLIPFPTRELFQNELGSFDLVILQNFNYGPYGIGIYLPELRRFVEDGGGLAMIGGDLSFTSGGYGGTPIEHVLPVRLSSVKGSGNALVSTREFRPHVTRQGWDHPVLQLADSTSRSRQLVHELPRWAGSNRVGPAQRDATVLASHPTLKTSDGRPMPVLATRQVKKGRTLALTTDSLWHWAFLSIGEGRTRQAYDRFWSNAIRWLINDPELSYLRVILQRNRWAKGAPVKLTIRAYHADYRPAQRATINYQIAALNGRGRVAATAVTDDAGEINVTYMPKQLGAFRVSASASIDRRETSDSRLFLVEAAGPETQHLQATDVLLKQLAQLSGGRHLTGVDALPDLPFMQPRVVRTNWQRDIELWNRWWWLAAVLAFLASEWVVRRRFGHF